jgi:type IV secretion system protein VirB10
MLFLVAAPGLEHAALAATKRSCSCSKPALRRRSRVRKAHTLARSTASKSRPNASLVGPVFATYTLPANQTLRVRMNQTISSDRSRVGERFTGTVLLPVYASGVEVVPAGSTVEGRVTSVSRARTRGREGRLAVAFDTLVLPDGTRQPIDGALTDLQDERGGVVDQESEVSGKNSDMRNIGYIGGGTAGGAILGGAIGGGKGAGIGAAIGAGAGVAGMMLQKGHEAEIRSGAEIGMLTTRPITFKVRER